MGPMRQRGRALRESVHGTTEADTFSPLTHPRMYSTLAVLELREPIRSVEGAVFPFAWI